ncbi:hypothetical protein [Trinickia fusca]|uniref:Uncharacterized protein n=1 Tax=Trinickia fusca TaxID=2419777 RepID=A0A494XQ58_9BURK|nr:hypothetical protein [Trinickia fusca]RKP50906.1 hypothetical protein D7S89_07525 [Trinickia fusca]
MKFDLRNICAGLCTALSLVAVDGRAQQAGTAGTAPAADARAGAQGRDAQAGAALDSLHGMHSEQGLLGGPAAYSDPYQAAYDSTEGQRTDLMDAERVPRGASAYGPAPATAARVGTGQLRRGLDDTATNNQPGASKAPETPAQSIYHDTGKPDPTSVYRSPW